MQTYVNGQFILCQFCPKSNSFHWSLFKPAEPALNGQPVQSSQQAIWPRIDRLIPISLYVINFWTFGWGPGVTVTLQLLSSAFLMFPTVISKYYENSRDWHLPPTMIWLKSPSKEVTVTPIPPSFAITSICTSSWSPFFFLPFCATVCEAWGSSWTPALEPSAETAGLSSLVKATK